ncbi:ATP-binding cassette sub-family G member 2-like isoform X2 [Biomphalaria glabrata]|uniref:Broad substrate specificity ATP-binding cassette transporter ABCG2-like n=1 Tax=Biomphalaria glabrata TaxID=6526 RepID=A0A2C9K4J9_BIOGL|nr:broad substrate specificity ATP-binding cassette transporter ABCG2-like [Biomphalaria glabrata]XP_055897828.1 broad substrate specificity ATP-binding cassette transporter ABCG2-like [Biomphalaria glabrata]KAI8778899.1 ATP-binding cassette sub-family G member 2 isoform X2 [Biomphalaria glabrata]
MNGHQMTIATIDVETSFANGRAHSEAPKGSVLSAHDINYTVQEAKSCCRTKDKQILFNVTGIFKQGMTAILGPTGSGKSSFLDVLAGRKDPAGVSGQLLLDGKPVPKNFKCMVGYVVQDDVVMGTLSVRENFAFSAALRLPSSIKASERKERINNVIKELGLERCADTKVGNEFIRGVSGGERKRCNIGMELIISPPVLFLDEPTTGLDANTANTVLLFLKRLSRHGRTVIFSIHQPRYSIYRLFDSLMLLSQGHTVYHGPSHEALEFFTSQGYVCQEHNNPPDFFLDVINGDPTTFGRNAISLEKEIESDFENAAQSQHDKLVEGFRNSIWNKNLQEEAKGIYSTFEARGGLKGERHEAVNYATSFFNQMVVVARRALINLIRNPQTSILTVATSIVFSVIIGAIYWQVSDDPIKGFKDRSGVLFFLIMNQLFFNMSAVEVFINERKIFMHENVSGFYRVSVYFLVKVIFDIIPLRMVPVIVLSVIVYFAVGLNPGADHFFLFAFCLFCTTVSAASLCFLISSIVRVFAVAQLLLALCYVLMMLLGGFLINFDSIGPWLHWAQYFSLFKYSLSILYTNEFKDRTFCSSSNSSICETGNSYLAKQDMKFETQWDFWQNYLALILYAIILFTLSYIRLRTMKKTT